MLLAVSWKDKGSSVAVKLPKKDSARAAKVLLREPVLPIRDKTNFGSHSASARKWFRGDRKVSASSGSSTAFSAGPSVSIRRSTARSSAVPFSSAR